MEKITKKINLILLIGLYLGCASKLYATQNDDVGEKKEDIADNSQDTSPNDADNEAGAPIIFAWDEKQQVDWAAACKSIKSCKAVTTIIDCLQYWQKVTNDIGQLGQILQYLSASNNYRDIVGAYHHVLDKHLNGKKNKEAFRFINGRLQQHITCNFAKCKGYDRNQRDRGNEKAEKDEIAQYGPELIFIRDTLDTIHAYLVHGSDSGHRYSPSNHKPHKVHKGPMDASNDDKKEADKATSSYTLFDEEMAALTAWQKSIRQQGRHQTKNKFSTDVAAIKQPDDKISFDLLAAHFTNNPTFALWLKYLRDNACDTDVLLNNIHDDVADNILYSGFKGAKKIVAAVANFMHQKEQTKQDAETNKKTAAYGFGVRLYYWDEYKNDEDKDRWYNPGHSYKDLYVAPFYPSFKNELLAKDDISISTWNQKMYAAKLMLAQSDTLKKLKERLPDTDGPQGLSVWHLLSIIFYTDFTALCTSFGESLRYLSSSESLNALIKRNSKWYYLSRYLREVVECFGTWISDEEVKGDTYYHGVSYLLFTQFSVHWYGPLSTSKQMEVATLFTTSTNNGLLLELKEDFSRLCFFNVCLLSSFGSEDERLFMGGRWPIQIATIRLLKDNINLQQIMHALFIVQKMIKRGEPGNNEKALPTDAAIYKDLCAPSTQITLYAQQIWNAFRHNQQRITINMKKMYRYYQAFMPLLCDPKHKNLLLLDKIAQLFPNVTKIICRETDFDIDKTEKSDYYEYSAASVCSNFILPVKEKLSKLDKHAKLTKIVIKTKEHEIKDDCNLYAPQFRAWGWQIGKGCNAKTIILTKESYDIVYKDVIPKIKSMLQAEQLSDNIPPSLDVPIFKQLIVGAKDIPADVQKQWDSFRHQQQRITIDMYWMYYYYKAFIPLLTDVNCKNLLLLDKIGQLFPNVTEIICAAIDNITGGDFEEDYSAAIFCSNFILGVKERLSKLDKQAKLTKIVIKTYRHEIKDDCKLYATQFGILGWQIQRGSYKDKWGGAYKNCQITLTKITHGNIWEAIIKEGVIPCTASLIAGKTPDNSKLTSASCMPIFNQLILRAKDVPADVQKQWDAFRHQQQHITINMWYMYWYYKAFIPLLFHLKLQHLLLLDKIAQLFPNVTKIICTYTDCVGGKYDQRRRWRGEYSAAIVTSNFMLGVKERLSKLDKHAKLTKIVIQTYKHEIQDDCNLYEPQFGALGWQVHRESWVGEDYWGDKIKHKNSQITLTHLKGPNTRFSNQSPALSEANGNKRNNHQLADNEVFDID